MSTMVYTMSCLVSIRAGHGHVGGRIQADGPVSRNPRHRLGFPRISFTEPKPDLTPAGNEAVDLAIGVVEDLAPAESGGPFELA